MVSLCTGAFALAGAGLLDGRPVATHWHYADELRARYPQVIVDSSVLYIDDGDILSSAGNAAGLDLCLHLVRTDHGTGVANRVARRMVTQPHRQGGQAQFIEAPLPALPGDDRIAAATNWALHHLDGRVTVADMARSADMSPRSFQRHFTAGTGTSPIRWLITQRLRTSLGLLERGADSVEHIARAVGFDSAVTYRHHFTRAFGTTPSAYRKAFRSRVSSDAADTARGT